MEVRLKKQWGRRPPGALISVSTKRAYHMMKTGLANPDAGFMAEYAAATEFEKIQNPPVEQPVTVKRKTPEEVQAEIDKLFGEGEDVALRAPKKDPKKARAKKAAPKKAAAKKAAPKKAAAKKAAPKKAAIKK